MDEGLNRGILTIEPQLLRGIFYFCGLEKDVMLSKGTAISYSDIQGGWSGSGEGNMSGDPRFRYPSAAVFRFLETSPCIDRGTPIGAPSIDLIGISRPKGEGYDIGAYEFFEYYNVFLPYVQDDP